MSPSALVVGGTGPTGPIVVDGLLARGYDVSIFHGGGHEVPFAGEVRHIHGDPHFEETIREALGTRTYDVVIAQYGRLRHIAEHFRGRTGHVVAIGAATARTAHPEDPRWGPLGRPPMLEDELTLFEEDETANKFGYRVAQAARTLFSLHHAGAFDATYIGYPILFGPRQPGAREWSIVRRILDGRREIILPDGGMKVESRGYVANVAAAPLLAVDQPAMSAGKSYVVADRVPYTEEQRVRFIADHLGSDVQFVDMPFAVATPAHPFYQHRRAPRIITSRRIRDELGYVDAVPADAALAATVDWLVDMGPDARREIENQLGDPFDYAKEDEVIAAWKRSLEGLAGAEYSVPAYAHIYRHPAQPNEQWTRPEDATPPL